ncbi:MAG: hypothetical protein ACHQ06_05270 [Candidatus Dormibacteria bacterium]|jgi:hypothetical protein
MNADPGIADGGRSGPGLDQPAIASRPWSIAAAMEPVPPLAPPPARPGHGVVVATTPRPAENTPGPRTVIAFVLLLAAIAIIVIVLLILGR